MEKQKNKVGSYFYDPINEEWTVRLEDAKDGTDSYFSCENQIDAEILSRLIRIETMLNCKAGKLR